MGTWAAGNFDNDQALDYMGELMDQLTKTVIGSFEKPAGLEDGGEAELMPSVAVIKILSEECGAAPPKPNEVEDWRSKYLAIYDAEIDGLGAKSDYKIDRRKVIDETFADLIKVANNFWKR